MVACTVFFVLSSGKPSDSHQGTYTQVEKSQEMIPQQAGAFMYDSCIELIEHPEHDYITLHIYYEKDELFQLGDRLNARFEDVVTNNYNWEVLIDYYVKQIEPTLMSAITAEIDDGMYAANISGYNPANLQTMKRFEAHVRALLKDEQAITSFIKKHYKEIDWD